jgi:hypothetical protein
VNIEKDKPIPSIFNDENIGSFICVLMHNNNMCDMYKSSLKHIHDPVLSSLKMEGIFDFFYVLSIKCSSSGGIRDTCITRCENLISTITMHNSAERLQTRQ